VAARPTEASGAAVDLRLGPIRGVAAARHPWPWNTSPAEGEGEAGAGGSRIFFTHMVPMQRLKNTGSETGERGARTVENQEFDQIMGIFSILGEKLYSKIPVDDEDGII